MEWWVWNTWWFLFSGRYSRLLSSTLQKNLETLLTNPAIHAYTNRINDRLVFTRKDGYKLEFETLQTMKLLGITKKSIDKTKNGENVPSLEVVEIVLVQYNLVDNQYKQKSNILYIFATNKSYAYLLNVKPSNLMFLKTLHTE